MANDQRLQDGQRLLSSNNPLPSHEPMQVPPGIDRPSAYQQVRSSNFNLMGQKSSIDLSGRDTYQHYITTGGGQ